MRQIHYMPGISTPCVLQMSQHRDSMTFCFLKVTISAATLHHKGEKWGGIHGASRVWSQHERRIQRWSLIMTKLESTEISSFYAPAHFQQSRIDDKFTRSLEAAGCHPLAIKMEKFWLISAAGVFMRREICHWLSKPGSALLLKQVSINSSYFLWKIFCLLLVKYSLLMCLHCISLFLVFYTSL